MKYFIRKILYKISRKLIKYFFTFSLIASILCGSIFIKSIPVDAAATATGITFAEVLGYIGSTIGIVNATTNNGVTSAFGHMQDSLASWWQQYSNDGIYEDSDGNIVFSGAATQAMYEALSSQSSVDARIISSWSGSYPLNTIYNSASLNTPISSWISSRNLSISNVLFIVTVAPGSDRFTTKIGAFDISNVAYFVVSSDSPSIYFYDSNGQIINTYCMCAYQYYYTSNGGSFSDVYSRNAGSYNHITFGNYPNNYYNNTEFYLDNYSDIYLTFPNDLSFSGSSIILSKSASAANQLLNQSSGYVIQNYYTELPTISKTVLQNNDWTSIYNSYVTNVQNNSESYTNQDGSIDISELRKILKRYNDSIVTAIADGVTNIADMVNYTNEWLDRIYNLLLDIRTILEEDGSGSGGGSSADLTNIETYLQSIDTDIGTLLSDLNTIEGYINTNNTQNQQIYSLLQNIYSALLNIGSGGGDNNTLPSPSDDPYKPWFDTLHDFPEQDVLELISKWDVIQSLLESIGPFALITGLTTVIAGLSEDPVDPVFTVPVSIERLNIDEEVTIDLTVFDDIIDLVHGLLIILFVVGVIILDWWLIPKLMYVLKI